MRVRAVQVSGDASCVPTALLVIPTHHSSHAHSSPDHNNPAQMMQALVQQLEAELRAAQLSADVSVLDRLIDDALLFTGPDGSLATKADDLALHRSGAVRFTEHEPSDLEWRAVASDVIVVALRARLAGVMHGQPFSGDYRYTRVWARRDDAWRIVAGHVSAVAMQNTV